MLNPVLLNPIEVAPIMVMYTLWALLLINHVIIMYSTSSKLYLPCHIIYGIKSPTTLQINLQVSLHAYFS